MQSSINIIKNERIINGENREISTQLKEASKVAIMNDNQVINKANMENYENVAGNMLKNAGRESKKIISKAYIEAQEIKTQAFNEGLEQGQKKGYDNAYKDAACDAKKSADEVRVEADDLLNAAKTQYNEYLIEKQQHIKDLVVTIAESILKKEIKEADALNEMIFNTLKSERNIKLYIIKSNSSHFDMIKSQIEDFKSKLAFQGDIFVIEDNSLDDGTAVIEKETGKSIVSIDYGIEKIVEMFQEEQIQT